MKRRLLVLLITLSFIISNFSGSFVVLAVDHSGIVLSQSFEDGNVGGWAKLSWAGDGTTEVSADVVSDGTRSLKFTRAAINSSPSLNITSLMQPGNTYDISLKVRIATDTDTLHLSGKVAATSLTNQYPWLVGNKTVNATNWTLYELKNYVVPMDTTEFLIWLEAADGATNTSAIYIDEVLIKDVTPVVEPVEVFTLSQSFEDGNIGGWAKLSWGGDGTTEVSADVASQGTKSLKFNRAAINSSPSLNITSLMQPGNTYDISLKVRIATDTDTLHLSGKVAATSLTNQYPWLVGNKTVNATNWTLYELKNYVVPMDTTEFLIWLEAADGATNTSAIYIDEVLIKDVTPITTPVDDGRPDALAFTTITFEDQTANGFVGREGIETLTVTNDVNHTIDGSYALKVEGREKTWNGPTLRVEQYIEKGQEYKITAWVKLLSPDSSQLQLSTQVGNSDGASYNNLQGKTITAADGWVQYEGTYRYSSVGDEYVTIYVESSTNATASFYIDDIRFESTGSGTVEIQKDLTPIKDVYKNDFLIGNIVSARDFEGNRLELLKMHHDVVTAENAMKPGYAYSTYPEFDLSAEDALVAQAAAAGLDMHAHVLVWHQQSEELLHTDSAGNPLSKEVALANLRTHISTIVTHFGDRVISWDVVNEAMNDNPTNPSDWRNALRTSGWKSAIGTDYVKEAFLAAKLALNGKNVKLYYNDYNDDNQSKAEAIYQMVKEINEEYGLTHDGDRLIDGIGMQAHYNLNTNPENVEKSLKKFISVTDEVSITELDITAGSNNTITEKQANQQAYLYARLFKLYKENADDIARVTFWGLDDATSWRAEQSPLLFDADLQAKPAYYAVIDPDKFISEYSPEVKQAKESTVAFGTPVVDGIVDAIWNTAPEMQVNTYQMAWQGAKGVAKVLWDAQYLYALIQISDAQLDKGSANPWEEDSVEIFFDQNNGKTVSYENDDGQYRVNFDNEASFSSAEISNGFASATKISGTNYIVEVKIPFTNVTPVADMKIGFDVQINDGKDGSRQSVAAWNDTTGTGYMDTSVYGVLTLLKNGNTGSTGNTTPTIIDNTPSSTPEVGPVEELEEVITDEIDEIKDDEIDEVIDESVPLGNGVEALPKTGGVPTVVYYAFGSGLAGLGFLLRRRKS